MGVATHQLVAAVALVSALAAGCTFLIEFQDKEDTTPLDKDAGDDGAGEEDGGEDLDSGSAEDVDIGAVCQGQANGFNWDPADEFARCCNGARVRTTVDEFCGTCEIACNKAKGQRCELFRGHYYCRGCDASADCWSGCCSKQFGGGSCAASNCATGACNQNVCLGGSVCATAGDASNYCKY
jgi:hypothetical protein